MLFYMAAAQFPLITCVMVRGMLAALTIQSSPHSFHDTIVLRIRKYH